MEVSEYLIIPSQPPQYAPNALMKAALLLLQGCIEWNMPRQRASTHRGLICSQQLRIFDRPVMLHLAAAPALHAPGGPGRSYRNVHYASTLRVLRLRADPAPRSPYTYFP